MTLKESAECVGVTEFTIRKLCKRGHLTSRKIFGDRRHYVTLKSVTSYIRAGRMTYAGLVSKVLSIEAKLNSLLESVGDRSHLDRAQIDDVITKNHPHLHF